MKVKLYDFFNVAKSEIILNPIMVICGDNGTGKTHLVKLLSSINESIMEGKIFDVQKEEINEFKKFFDIDYIKDCITKNQNVELSINESNLDTFYLFIEKLLNKKISKKLNYILKNTYVDGQKKLKKLEMTFIKKVPMSISIFFKPIINREIIEDILSNHKLPTNVLSMINDKLEGDFNSSFDANFNIESQNFKSSFGFSMLSEELALENKLNNVLETLLEYIFAHMYQLNISNTKLSRNYYYLPASREAYHKDLELFTQKRKNKNNTLISRYVIDDEGKKFENFYSMDPFIEKYIDNILEVLATKEKPKKNNDLDKFLNYFEKNILKAEILVDSGNVNFKLPNKDVISADMASSLQNEYSFLKILIERVNKPNLIIEEPESHLSIKNAISLAYFLICFQEKHSNILWITTHNNFVGDAINNLIMISKLDEKSQKFYLEKIGLSELLTTFRDDISNKTHAYLLQNDSIMELPKNDYGIDFNYFKSHINSFIDISSELQFALENTIDTN
ncbi:hypothetical protein [Lysinibacillus fusiformis]|uniref:hypothetical protein n=1 Tax=Lysinibacillus fusiformis TaxID=28031 RepID=UPI00381BEC2D